MGRKETENGYGKMNRFSSKPVVILLVTALIGPIISGIIVNNVTKDRVYEAVKKATVEMLAAKLDFISSTDKLEDAINKIVDIDSQLQQAEDKAEVTSKVNEEKISELNNQYNNLKADYDKLNNDFRECKRTGDIISDAKLYASEGRLDLAISMIDSLDFTENPDAKVLEKDYIERFEQQIIESANSYINAGDYDTADRIISDALSNLPNSSTLTETKKKISELRPSFLLDILSPYEIHGTYYKEYRGSSFSMAGEDYTNGFTFGVADKVLFNLKGEHKLLTGIIGHYESSTGTKEVVFYVDGIEKKSVVIEENELPKPFELNLEGAKQLIIQNKSHYNYIGIAELRIR